MNKTSRKYSFELSNGKKVEFTCLEPEEVQSQLSDGTWKVHEKLSPSCTIYINEQGQVLQHCFADKAGLLFNQISDHQAKKGKVVIIRREDNQELIIFNLLDEKELQLILNNNKFKKIKELSKKNDFDILLLENGKILKAHLYSTYGELYKDSNEYKYMRENWEMDYMLIVPGTIKK